MQLHVGNLWMTHEHVHFVHVESRLSVESNLGDTYKQNCTKTKIIASVNFTPGPMALSL